jgi:hypothetical protein
MERMLSENFGKLHLDIGNMKNRLVIVEDNQTELSHRVQSLEQTRTQLSNVVGEHNRQLSKQESYMKECSKRLSIQESHLQGHTLKLEMIERNLTQLDIRTRNTERTSHHKNVSDHSDDSSVEINKHHQSYLSENRTPNVLFPLDNRNPREHEQEGHITPSEIIAPGPWDQRVFHVNPELRRENNVVTRNTPVNFPSFAGEVDIDIYKRQCKALASSHNWADRDLASQIIANLKGDARELISLLPEGGELDLDAIWDTLSSRFSKVISCDAAKHQLLNYVQRRNQTFLNLSLELEKLVAKAYPSADRNMMEQLAVDHFLKAVNNPSLRYELRMKRVTTLTEARMEAEAISMILNAERYARPVHVHRMLANTSSDSEQERESNSGKKKRRKRNDLRKDAQRDKSQSQKSSSPNQSCVGNNVTNDDRNVSQNSNGVAPGQGNSQSCNKDAHDVKNFSNCRNDPVELHDDKIVAQRNQPFNNMKRNWNTRYNSNYRGYNRNYGGNYGGRNWQQEGQTTRHAQDEQGKGPRACVDRPSM